MNILITGGASGLGEAITRLLASNTNNKVYFTYASSAENARKIESECSNTTAIQCNFKDVESVKSLTSSLEQLNLDVLINNAFSGDFLKSHFHKIPSADFLQDFKDNIMPVIEITQESIKAFRKKKNGKIITVLSSAIIELPPMGAAVYVANKAYLEKLTKVWATENVKYNITSNAVSPSFMKTRLTSEFDERIIEQMTENHPLKKLLTVEEVAETVQMLTTASPHVNGVNFVVNAGTAVL